MSDTQSVGSIPTSVESWADVYRLYREQIDHEDDLVNQRLSLLVASQSFLFTAYAIVLNGSTTGMQSMFAFQHRVVFWSIPIIATCLCWFIGRSITAAMAAMSHARARWSDYRATGAIPEYAPEIQGSDHIRRLGQLAPRFLPHVFIAVWTSLYVVAPITFYLCHRGTITY